MKFWCRYLNQKLSSKRVCYENIKHGPRGLRGATGATGAIGATGATGPKGDRGPSGENLVVKSTKTLPPEKEANVKSTHIENTTYLEFEITRGYNGVPEKILAGKTNTIEPNDVAKVEDRYEGDVHFLDFQIPKGKTGEKGETGAQGIQGVQGNKGEPGEKGETGKDGRSETIIIDKTHTIEPSENANVQDNFENNTHFLTFYIPKGEKGEKGERGEKGDEVIMAGTTTLIGENEPAKVEDRYENDVHFLDFQIPKGKTGEKGEPGEKGPQGDRGPQGVKGEQGVAGPPGTTNNINATIYEENSQEIANGRPLMFGTTLTNNGMSINNASITIQYTGTYIVSFSINNGSSATAGDCVGIYSNNTLVGGTKRPLTSSTNVSCTIELRLKANDVITLVPTLSSNRTLTNSGAPSAMLTVVQIA